MAPRLAPPTLGLFLLWAFLSPETAFPAGRPGIDAASSLRPAAAGAERLARARADARLAGLATPAHVDERYGVPSFLWATRTARASRPATAELAARDFLARVAPFYALDDDDVESAVVRDVHDTGRGGIIVSLRREVDGVEVFRDEMKILLGRDLTPLAVAGSIPGRAEAGPAEARAFRLDAVGAIGFALDDFEGAASNGRGAVRHVADAPGGYATYVGPAGLGTIRARRVLFHLPGALVPGWYVELLGESEAIAYVVSAVDGTLLFRHGLTEADAYSYRVWADTTALRAPLDGPQGSAPTPHPAGWPNGWLPSFVPPVLQSLSSGPISTNDPWLAPGATETRGNNVDAYADLLAPDGFSAGDLRATTNGTNAFDRTYDPALDPAASADQQMAAVTQVFYTGNFLHDWFYDAGFDEAAGNAQAANYGRGGVEGDALRAEIQDYLGFNNANMTTPADGGAPRMQMFRFAHPAAPVRDGALDNLIVAHEWGHALSQRLVGNSAGLTNPQGRGLGEGWSDFVAMLVMVRPEDAGAPAGPDFTGAYAPSGYALQGAAASETYYFGGRRYPYSTDFAKNPLTFRHVQDGEALPAGPPVQVSEHPNSEVHHTGEIWCNMLWECYASLLRDDGRLPFDEARDRMRRYLVASLKLTPNAPTFVEARDALLAAALAEDPVDFTAFCAAFARRGLGISAVAPDRTSTTLAGVVESFACGGDFKVVSATLDDSVQSCDQDGVLDDGETGWLTITLRNTGSIALGSTVAALSSANPAVEFPDGTEVLFPPSAPFGTTVAQVRVGCAGANGIELQDIRIEGDDPEVLVAGPRTLDFVARGNSDFVPSSEEHVEADAPGWVAGGTPLSSADEPWRKIAGSVSSHWFHATAPIARSDQWLVSPPLLVGTDPFSFTFRHAFTFHSWGGNWYDGGVVEISADDGQTWSDVGGSIAPGYGGTLATGSQNPLAGRPAFIGTSPGYPALQAATASLGTTHAGQVVRIRFRLATNWNTGSEGWRIDDLVFSGLANSPFVDVAADPTACTPVAVDADLPAGVWFAATGANPSRGVTRFRFGLPRASHVVITVHDVAGRQVARVADGPFAAGVHDATWSPGAGRASGVYFVRFRADGQALQRRVVRLGR